METIAGRYTLELSAGSLPLSTDSMVLADFVRLPANARVLDLGSGCGTLGLLLCARDSRCSVTGLELNPADHAAALENIRRNGLGDRLYSVCADLRAIPETLARGSFHVCLSNPPYFSGGAVSTHAPLARSEGTCAPGDLFAAAASMLRYGGDFFLVHKPERLAQLCVEASNARLEPKRLRLVRHRENGPISLILLQCRKGGKSGLIIEELSLFHADGTPTQDRRRIYHE
ncbi:MAG: methyltransferase [Oscillospiraceae bacterium]|nr:methyltransferase [Oscillospiraceae bacterium]